MKRFAAVISIILYLIPIVQVPGQAESAPRASGAFQEYLTRVKGTSYWPIKVLFSPDANLMAAGFSRNEFSSGSMLFQVDYRNDKVQALAAGFHIVRDLKISSDNSCTIAAGGMGRNPFFEGELIVWPARGDVFKIMDLEAYSGETFITSLAVSGDGRYFLSGSGLPTAKLYSRDGVLIRTFFPYGSMEEYRQYGSSCKVDISPDRKYVLTHTKNSTKLWEFEGVLKHSFNGFQEKSFPCFTPGSAALAVIDSNALEFYDLQGNLVRRIDVPVNGEVLAPPAFSSDGKKAALLVDRGALLIINIAEGTTSEMDIGAGITLPGGSISFGPGDDYIAYTHRGLPGFRVIHIPTLQELTFCCFDSGDWLVYEETGFHGSPGALAIMAEGGFKSNNPALLSGFFKGGGK